MSDWDSPSETRAARRRPVRVNCALGGGPAPCIDDLCHGVDQTMCGLFVGTADDYSYDVCPHGNLPGTCDEYPCDVEEEDF